MTDDIRKSWFMQQHFTTEELESIYQWEQVSGKTAVVIPTDGYSAYHVADTSKSICLCTMAEEYMLRRWIERLGYKTWDGMTAKEFEEAHGIITPPVIQGTEVFRKGKTSITQYGDTRFSIVSGDYSIIAKRTAANAYDIMLVTREEYGKWLEEQKKG